MTSVELERLFDTSRFPRGVQLLPILLYFPLGVCLALVRLFIGVHAFIVACILPKTSSIRCLILRVMCTVLGIVVTQQHVDAKQSTRRANIIVANYCSTLDHLAIELFQPSVMISVWDLPACVIWMLGYKDLGAQHGQDTLINNIHMHCTESDIPLVAFPEGATTNGMQGLLKFSSWPFALDRPIQPIVIQISRPAMFAISPSVLGSQWWADIFWFLFVPVSIFHLRFLEIVKKSEDENAQEFARRVQTMMACVLEVEPTTFTAADKSDLVRHLTSSPAHSASYTDDTQESNSSTSDAMERMIHQVKVVLPHVPVRAIRKDLELTKDTDLTITNILEGRVIFDPIEPSIEAERTLPSASAAAASKSTRKPPLSSHASSTFGKSPTERQTSFQERKQQMLDNARRRYLDKHPSLEHLASSTAARH